MVSHAFHFACLLRAPRRFHKPSLLFNMRALRMQHQFSSFLQTRFGPRHPVDHSLIPASLHRTLLGKWRKEYLTHFCWQVILRVHAFPGRTDDAESAIKLLPTPISLACTARSHVHAYRTFVFPAKANHRHPCTAIK